MLKSNVCVYVRINGQFKYDALENAFCYEKSICLNAYAKWQKLQQYHCQWRENRENNNWGVKEKGIPHLHKTTTSNDMCIFKRNYRFSIPNQFQPVLPSSIVDAAGMCVCILAQFALFFPSVSVVVGIIFYPARLHFIRAKQRNLIFYCCISEFQMAYLRIIPMSFMKDYCCCCCCCTQVSAKFWSLSLTNLLVCMRRTFCIAIKHTHIHIIHFCI